MPQGLKWPTPPGWTRDAFALPPTWSPQLPANGWAEFRLAPGFADARAADYATSAYALWVEGASALDGPSISGMLETYYRDRCLRGSGMDAGTFKAERFSASLVPVSEPASGDEDSDTPSESTEGDRFRGSVETYACPGTGAELTLHLDVTVVNCAQTQHHAVVVLASPKADGDVVWHGLDTRLAEFQCR